MSTKQVYDYVMKTPKNTNPAVLSSMLGHLSWNDLKDKPFYSGVETHVIFDNVTTTGDYLSSTSTCDYSPDYDDTFTFVIDGVTYDEVALWYMDEDGVWCFDVEGVEGEGFYCGATYGAGGPKDKRWYLNCSIGHTVSFIITRKVDHQVLPMFLPNSVWGEEETLTILDNVKLEHDGSASSSIATFHADFNMKVGDILTLVIDGVKYPVLPEFIQYSNDGHTNIYAQYNGYKIWHTENYPDEENNWRIEHYGGTVSLFITRTKVKTNCDLMIGVDADGNLQLMRGNYSNALTKALGGLPVSAYFSAVGVEGATNSMCQVFVNTDQNGDYVLDVLNATGEFLIIDRNNNISLG